MKSMKRDNEKIRVLFLCTGNSCRSQMAEGWTRHLKGDLLEAYSAGTAPHGLNSLAVKAMKEAGVDISGQQSKHIDAFAGQKFDYLITVCDSANESCPIFPGAARRIHVDFQDPPKLAANAKTEEEALQYYRRVRDEIRVFVESLPEGFSTSGGKDVGSKDADAIRQRVREGYGSIARSQGTKEEGSCCCGGVVCGYDSDDAETLVKGIGYNDSDLAALPAHSNMGLSCGNPTAIASLREGEVVLDLGSGGGFDVFIAGRKVGARGRVIGVDMTADMISLARSNIAAYRASSGLENVEFRLGEIEHLPVADSSIDVVISNCVLNLSPDKGQVWREIARVLKPGGRAAISDLALKSPLPEEVAAMTEALIGCIAGAPLVEETRRMIEAAGLASIKLTEKPQYIEAMSRSEDELYQKIAALLPKGRTIVDFATSLNIEAIKPLGV